MKIFFYNKSKGEVLQHLKNYNIKFKIPKTILINVIEWKKNKKKIYIYIKKEFKNIGRVALRSSSRNEDLSNSSNAGKYASFLDVKLKNQRDFFSKVEKIILSYNESRHNNDQIIIQEMITRIYSSGVIFTKDIENGANYYVINYDDVTGKTDTVTSGFGHYSNRILNIYKNFKNQIKSKRFKKLIIFVKDLEKKINNDHLDIEFAITKSFKIYLLQVRPISTKKKWKIEKNKFFENSILKYEKKINHIFKKNKNYFGKTTILGNMPDWNPVEIIGKHPNELSYSLYRYLITDEIWAKARSYMGYRDVSKNKLMMEVMGQPYIDTRLSLNSFLPKNLSKNISEKIVNHGINLLSKFAYFHDKIEFEISIPSYNFSTEKKVHTLFKKILKKKEKKIFIEQIKNLTKIQLQSSDKHSLSHAIQETRKLNNKFDKINNKNIGNLNQVLSLCRNVGTLNFSILARHGFIAKSFLNSLIEKKILNNKDLSLFEQSLNTITTEMLKDSYDARFSKKKQKIFMKKYGHLRPGTYDITSKRYDQMKNFKFNNKKNRVIKFKLKTKQRKKIDNLLNKNKFNLTPDKFINYIKNSLIMREYSKFVFTKYLSLALEIIGTFANKKKISRSQISNINLQFFLGNKYLKLNKKKILNLSNKKNKEKSLNKKIKLPSLIIDKSNLRVIPFQVNLPNFVTKKKVEGEYINLEKIKNIRKLDDKIVLIENADPGYDWIFGHKILGLITKYGGINSHMAIRCSELSLPAVIGCGEQIYLDLLKKKEIFIDCSSSLIYSTN